MIRFRLSASALISQPMLIRLGEFARAHMQFGQALIAVLLLPAITVVALWFPFGFSLGGFIEEWNVLFLFAQHGVFYIADAASPLALQQARPLTVLPQAVAYTLDPNSFLYWHIVQAGSLIVKGASAGMLGIYLTRNLALAALLALLTLLYPADTMQLSFRSLHINCAVALALLGNVVIIFATQVATRSSRLILATVASTIFSVALLMYEPVIGLAVLPLLIIFARQGVAATWLLRERLDVFFLWTVAIGAWLSFFLWSIGRGSQYHLLAFSDTSFSSLVYRAGALATSGLYRAFYECWIELGQIILMRLSNFAYPLCFTALLLLAFVWLAGGRSEPVTNCDKASGARLVAAGLAAFLVAYTINLYELAHVYITQRTFLVPAIGAALVVLGGVVFLSAILDRRLVGVVSAALVGGCFVVELYQFDKYSRIYATTTKPLLSALAPYISAARNRRYSVIFNDYGYLSGTWDLGELQLALGYVLPGIRASFIFICETRSGRLLPRRPGPTAKRGYCRRTEEGVMLTFPDEAQPTLLRDAAVVELGVDGVTSAEESELTPIPHMLSGRVQQLLAPSKWEPAESMFRRQERPDQFECRFESMWGYASPCHAFGFYDSVPYRAALGSSYAWIGETTAGMIFDIQPSHPVYQLIVEVVDAVSPSRGMELSLNGTKLTEGHLDATSFRATFPSYMLRNQHNILELRTELDSTLGLSFAVKTISIIPVQQ